MGAGGCLQCLAIMVAHAAVGVAIAVTAMSSSNCVSLAGFENCRVRLWNARSVH